MSPEISERILYEDNHLIAINKRVGEIIQGDKTGDLPLSESLKSFLKEKYNKPGQVFMGVIHRIDRPVSGVVVFAKTSKALSRMNQLIKDRKLKKTYWAIVKQLPQSLEGELEHWLVRNAVQNKSTAYDQEVARSKKAVMTYRLIHSAERYHLLEIGLITGRHHQIRAQLAKIGSPIRGDLKYGFARSNADGGISLHARSVEFIHPVKKERLQISAPLPSNDELWQYFESPDRP